MKFLAIFFSAAATMLLLQFLSPPITLFVMFVFLICLGYFEIKGKQ